MFDCSRAGRVIYLLDQINGGLKIQTEIHKFPIDVFPSVFFLFQNEHRMIEKLLQLFIGVINAQLFEGVQLENFETGDIEYADKRGTLTFASIERFVDTGDNPFEHTFVDRFGDRFDSIVNLRGIDILRHAVQ